MSAEHIEFAGDDLARRVPLLGQFRTDLKRTVDPLLDVAACHWADGVPGDDDVTLQAKAAISGMLDQYVLPVYALLADAVGFQGEKLHIVRQIGDNTEAGNSEAAGGWGGGRHG